MNTHLQVALSGAVPALLLMWLVDRLDAKRPEPRGTRRLVVVAGMLSVIPALILEVMIPALAAGRIEPEMTYQGSSFQAFIVAAGVEEACKIAMVYWVVWRRPEFDERMDGIVYASRGGLGFALVENVLYLFKQHSLQGQIIVWVERALLAVPGHAMWTGMIGAMAARRRFDGKGLGLLGGYLLAVAFHGAYDVSVFLQRPLHLEGRDTASHILLVVPVLLTVLAFLVLRAMARTALRLDDAEAARTAARSALPPLVG
ncbi:MAG TPA: PrsW family intramembrane metalloprotease [Kofleriaceae bacterium]|jgi:RsiW-degrading membrane proteinase PrsW (M82 family)|nr:PrsW family intramembrane metalloprotease [Kofleriaceae bacterium]